MNSALEYPPLIAQSEPRQLEESKFESSSKEWTYTRSIGSYMVGQEGPESEKVQVDKHVFSPTPEWRLPEHKISVISPLKLPTMSTSSTGQPQAGLAPAQSTLPRFQVRQSWHSFVLDVPGTQAPDKVHGISHLTDASQDIELNRLWWHPVDTSKIEFWAKDGLPTSLYPTLNGPNRMPVRARMWPPQTDAASGPSAESAFASVSKARSSLWRMKGHHFRLKVAKIFEEAQNNLSTQHHLPGSFVFKHLDIDLGTAKWVSKKKAPRSPYCWAYEFRARTNAEDDDHAPVLTWIYEYDDNTPGPKAAPSLSSGLSTALSSSIRKLFGQQAGQTTELEDAQEEGSEPGETEAM